MTEQQRVKVFSFLISFFAVMSTGIYVVDRQFSGDASVPGAVVRGAIISLIAAPFIYLYFRGKER